MCCLTSMQLLTWHNQDQRQTQHLTVSLAHWAFVRSNVGAVCLRSQEEALRQEQRERAKAARDAAIVAEERAALLRGARHLRNYLPGRIADEMQNL